jgi:hypothetical protein
MSPIKEQIKKVRELTGLTAYGIAQVIDTKEFRNIQARWQRWMSGKGLKTLETLENDLDSLGYKIEIKKK